jgi:hypothetical protein
LGDPLPSQIPEEGDPLGVDEPHFFQIQAYDLPPRQGIVAESP